MFLWIPTHPRERLEWLLQDAAVTLVLTERSFCRDRRRIGAGMLSR